MRSTISLLAALLVMGTVTLAQPRRPPRPQPRATTALTDAAVTDADVTDADVTDAAAAPPDDGRARTAPTCCCRAWSHGWQYAWRTEVECRGQNGTCVSPDHC